MLTGVTPDRHQVLWNTVVTAGADLIEQPTIFGVARAKGFRTAAFFSKPKFQPLQQPGTLDYSQAPGGWWGLWDSARTMGDVAARLPVLRPNLAFIHLADVDTAGHRAGWMSADYGRAVSGVDAALAALVRQADAVFGAGSYTLIVTADHGGHGKGHGTDDPRDVTASEVLGNVDAMIWAIQSLSAGGNITLDLLLEAHRRLLQGTRLESHGGQIREEQNWIGGSNYNPCSAAFVPPPPEYVSDLMADLCAFSNDDLPTPL